MNKKYAKVQSTRRSLIMSVLSLVLCFAMLLGTTYAWFTDEVTSGTNQIKAGNLDVELLYADKDNSGTVGATTKLFDDVTLWEPGAYAYETFTIKNVGNLAFKYSMQINAYNAKVYNNHSLDEVLKVKVVDTAPESRPSYTDGTALKNWSLGETEKPLYPVSDDTTKPSEKTFTVVVYWAPTDNDNQWNMNNGNQGKVLSVDLGINLVATQLQYESDSFGTDYDKTAAIGLPSTPITEELTESLKIVVPQTEPSTEAPVQSSVKEATVPAAVANAVFNTVFASTPETVTDKSLTLVLNVEEKSKTETTFNYDIDMDAVIKEMTGDTVTKSETKSVNQLGINFTDFVEVQMTIASGLDEVVVKHNGSDMTKAASKEAIPAENQDPDGYFNYDKATGNLKLWTKSFSPFTVSGKKPFLKVVHSDGSETPYFPKTSEKTFALSATKQTDWEPDTVTKVFVADNDKIVLLDDCNIRKGNNWAGVTAKADYEDAKDYCLGMLNYTIDLNGHTISAKSTKGNGALEPGIIFKSVHNKGNLNLTISDSSTTKTGKFIVNGNGSLFSFATSGGSTANWTININGGTFIANETEAGLFSVLKVGDYGINGTKNKLVINVNGGCFNRDINTETTYKYYQDTYTPIENYTPVVVPNGYTFGSLGNGMYGLIVNN